jgi:hypothetical protein
VWLVAVSKLWTTRDRNNDKIPLKHIVIFVRRKKYF